MTYYRKQIDLHFLLCFIIVLSCIQPVKCQQTSKKSTFIKNSTLTSVGSANVSLSTSNNNYLIEQSIGQSSIIGLSETNSLSVQQGFLNNILVINIDNPETNITQKIKFKVYPNPVNDYFYITFSKTPINRIKIGLFDITNKLILAKTYPPEKKTKVMLNDLFLNEGTYILQVISDDTKYVEKLIQTKL